MGKIVSGVLFLLEIILFVCVFALNYLTSKKMGVLRYVANKNLHWERDLPINLIKYLVVAILIAFIILTLLKLLKLNSCASKMISSISIAAFFVIGIFILVNSTATYKAYYFMSAILMIASIIHMVNFIILSATVLNNR